MQAETLKQMVGLLERGLGFAIHLFAKRGDGGAAGIADKQHFAEGLFQKMHRTAHRLRRNAEHLRGLLEMLGFRR